MASHQVFTDVLTDAQLQYINSLPEVTDARRQIESGAPVAYFSVTLNESIKSTLQERLGLDLSTVSQIPLRWIRGDTTPHVDVGASAFDNTYLLYLNDSAGELRLESDSYPIRANTAFVFNEGLSHETLNTGAEPRLLLGPMNEFAQPVGGVVTYFFQSQADALAYPISSPISAYGSYTIPAPGFVGGYTHWRLASNSTGPDPQNVVYTTGQTLNGNGTTDIYYLYPTAPCFLEGSKILCRVEGVETYVPVENLRPGTLVKTSRDGYKKVEVIGKGTIRNPGTSDRIEDRLYKCSPAKYPALTEDLFITGCHSILEFPITEKQKEDTISRQGKLYVTDKKYRLMACVDERAEPWAAEGTYTIWHFALEHEDDGMNYGVYANGGLLVETCSIRTLKNKSNFTIL
jgi:hypothetical protein